MCNKKYEFYNPLKVGDVVIVDYLSRNPYYHRYYIDTVKSIKQINENDYICRLHTFNYDFELLNQKDIETSTFSAVQDESGVYTILNGKLAINGFSFTSVVYSIDEFKQLLQKRNNTDKDMMRISDYNHLIKMYQILIEAIELQNKNSIKQFYTLRIDDAYGVTESFVYFYKEKPSIATIRRQIGASCNFKTAEEIYKTEPIDYEYDDLCITLQPIDISCFEKDIDNKYDIYANNTYESDETIEFIKEFKQKYNKKLEELYNKLNTLLSIDELIFDWFTDIDFNNDTLEDFIKFIKDSFKFKEK